MSEASASDPPSFLRELLDARSPSGYEQEIQAVVDRTMGPISETYRKDTIGNRMASIGDGNDPTLMLAGHMDELGMIVSYVDDKGFVYFQPVGGHDRIMIPGRRVTIIAKAGDVRGVTGKRAIHLMTPEDRKKIPQIHEMWIDIGATSKEEALERISLGDPIVYTHGFEPLHGSVGIARGFDNKSGCYVVNEVVRRLAETKSDLQANVVAVSTSQEEIGTRGAIPSAFSVNPHFGIAVDVGHATDHPDCDARKVGKFTLGGGPIVYRGANINPVVFEKLLAAAESANIPVQVKAEAGPTPTDARALQMARAGVATGLVAIPLRYMHTPSEVVDLNDVEACVELIRHFALSLEAGGRGDW
ncbi:MAG: M20/M25/M40 family metallo-hydrolase [Verrucomicrobiota bacterium]